MDVQKIKRKYTRKKISTEKKTPPIKKISRKRDFSKYEKSELLKICEILQKTDTPSPVSPKTHSPTPKTPTPVSPRTPTPKKATPRTPSPEIKKITKKKKIKSLQKTKKVKDIKDNLIITTMTPDETINTKKNIENFKQNGMTALEKLDQKGLDQMIFLSNDVYYNTKENLMTDNEYDIVKEYILANFPNDIAVQQVGAPIGKNKVQLPYEMWSMDKIKPDTNALSLWMTKYKGPYLLSCKLDGVSGLYTTEGETPKLYTRGDGKVGQDISHLLTVLKLPKTKGIVVRGEFIIPKKVFETKYATTFANPRNLTSGIINSKTIDDKASDIHFVTYECIMPQLPPSEQLIQLKELGFDVVDCKIKDSITNEILSEYLIDKRTNYEYEIDGIIVADDRIYTRMSGNPDHAFAFKMVLSDQKAEAKVVDVLWEPSKDGYLKPRVRIEPIHLGGVTITYATGYNAKFIEDNKIGIGAIIELVRSGDVIPKILKVIVPAEKAKLPNESYTWNDTHVDILLDDASSNKTVREKNIVLFFTELEVDGLKAGNVKKLMDSGFDTIPKILSMTQTDFEKVGYRTTADKYVTNIKQKLDDSNIVTLMVASGMMGRGIGNRKITPILEAFPNIITSSDTRETKISNVKTVNGIEQKTAQTFVDNIPKFIEFLKECELEGKLTKTVSESKFVDLSIDTTNPLFDKKIVMTKVRDKEIMNELAKYGATLEDDIKKTTFVLIIKSKEDVSNKTKYANTNNIPIMTPEEFKALYFYSV
jgi:DNA ligase (NAD+)